MPEYFVKTQSALGTEKDRCTQFQKLLLQAGGVGQTLFKLGTYTSRQQGAEMKCVWVVWVNLERYEQFFSDADVFGELSTYSYNATISACEKCGEWQLPLSAQLSFKKFKKSGNVTKD